MRTVAFYRERAAECRAIAKHISLNEPLDELLEMARDWDALADEREAELRIQARDARATAEGQAGSRDDR